MKGVDFISVPGPKDPREYRYSRKCMDAFERQWPDRCDENGELPPPEAGCESGTMVDPRWSNLRGGPRNEWRLDTGYSCPGDSNYPIAYDDFANLPIAPSPTRIQPDQTWVYAGLDTIALTSDAPQGFAVELRGQTYNVGAVPVDFTWDFGDTTPPLVTTDPGKPWPDHTIAHTYTTAGTATPTLTTRWRGVFQIAGLGEWHDIPGTAETISTGPELTIHAPRTRLVEDPVD